jgi:hypothetical protein
LISNHMQITNALPFFYQMLWLHTASYHLGQFSQWWLVTAFQCLQGQWISCSPLYEDWL